MVVFRCWWPCHKGHLVGGRQLTCFHPGCVESTVACMRESLSVGRLQGVIELGAIVIEQNCHGGHRVAFD